MGCVSLPKCFMLQTPGFGVVFNVRKNKRQALISVSKSSNNVPSSISITHKENINLVKEETEFKSSFDEYLKAMETIRVDREKKKGQEKVIESIIDDREKKKGQKEGSEHSKKLKDVAFTKSAPKNFISEGTRIFKRSKGSNFDEKDKLYEGFHVVANKAQPRVTVKERVAVNFQKGLKYVRSKDDLSNNSFVDVRVVTSSKSVWKKSIRMVEMTSDDGLEMEELQNDVQDGRRVAQMEMGEDDSSNNSFVDVRAVTSSKSVWKKSTPMVEITSDDDLEMEELQIDVQDGRRVTQMEMGERIQKLATCLNEADVEMPGWMFSKMMRSARIRFSDTSIMRIIQILGKLGNWRMVLQVVEWLQVHERFKSYKIRYVYTAALGVLGKARRPVEALNLFIAMQRHRISYPDIVAYRSIAVTLGQAGHMKELFDVIDSMRSMPTNSKIESFEDGDPRLEPDIVVYNAVLNACAKRKEWEGAFWVLQKLAEIDQPPSSTTYGLLMEVMLTCGKYELVHDFFRQMEASYTPNALSYRGILERIICFPIRGTFVLGMHLLISVTAHFIVLVNTLWREGKPDQAVAAVREMESRGLVGSASLYYDLARCLCSAGRCEEALMQVDKICKVANKPLLVTYTGLMQACFDSGNIEDGIFIFNHMQKYCYPNLVTCNQILKAYLGHGMFAEAKELFQKMTQNGKQGSRLNVRITPDIHTFNVMLEACVKNSKWDDFSYAYDQMLKHGHPFNTKRHMWMVLQASKAGKVEVVEMTWMHLMKSSRVPPPALVKERFRLKMENGDLASAMSSVASHPSSHQKSFSKEAWLELLAGNVHCFNKEDLVQLICEINVCMSNCEFPNLIYQNLRDSCAEFVGLNETVIGRRHLIETLVEV